MISVGVDTGGTFTDFVALDHSTGRLTTAKVPSRAGNPAAALREGLGKLLEGRQASEITIGTTTATNAVLEREGPTVVFVTNAGFEDVPFIARLDKEVLYDVHWTRPEPLVARRDTIGVACRLDHHGAVSEELTDLELERFAERLAAYRGRQDVAIAISLLFSYHDGTHERRLREVCQRVLGEVPVSISSDVAPVWREYERGTTTLADAFVKPAMGQYVRSAGEVVGEGTEIPVWNLLTSNGGFVRAAEVQRRPAQMLVSGLAGGVIGARALAHEAQEGAVFTLDVGGTSSDIGLIEDGVQQYVDEFSVGWGLNVAIPAVAVETIGAGGGSIAWVDAGGMLQVGPASAGARPGPAAYGHGGTDATVTDANIVLGRLDPDFFLGGAMSLDVEAARRAVGEVAERLGLGLEETALAIVQIVDESMANAIRLFAMQRGLDVRDFALMAFGGAGALHAWSVAARLRIGTVLVPRHPGVISALGCALAEPRVDRFRTAYMRSDDPDLGTLAQTERDVRAAALEDLGRSVDVRQSEVARSASMRYVGQNYEIDIALPDGELDGGGWPALLARFHEQHERQYGFSLEAEPAEVVGLRVTARRPASVPTLAFDGGHGRSGPERRAVWFDGDAPLDCSFVRRDDLDEHGVVGPAVILEEDSTVLVPPGVHAAPGRSGVLRLSRRSATEGEAR